MGIAMATSNSNQRKKQKKRRRTNISLKGSVCRFFLFYLKKYMSVVMAMGNIGVFFFFFVSFNYFVAPTEKQIIRLKTKQNKKKD